MITDGTPAVSYPASRGFILQFEPAGENDRQIFAGRIEHIVSGKVQHFFSPEEFNSVVRAMLVELEEENSK